MNVEHTINTTMITWQTSLCLVQLVMTTTTSSSPPIRGILHMLQLI